MTLDTRTRVKTGRETPSRRLAPLGVPVLIRATDRALLEATGEAYAEWPAMEDARAAIELNLTLAPDAAEGPVDIVVERPRLTLAGGGVSGFADGGALRGACRIPRRLARDPAVLRTEVLDTLLLFLLAHADRTPLHAAGVMFGRRLVVLAGPSGSGKSTLALAAAARGLQILSDDTLYIQLRPHMRLWGLRRPIHVFPQDAPRFTGAVRLRGGKLKAAIALSPASAGPPFVDDADLILLERGERLALKQVEPSFARAKLAKLDPGFDLFPEESAATIQALTRAGAWRLTLSRDPGEAIEFLRDHLPAAAG